MNKHEGIPEVTIALISFKDSKYIINCLKSLYRYTKAVSFEVRIIANLSSEHHLNSIRELFPDIKPIVINEALSHSANNNMVLRNASGRYYLVLNDDTYLISDIISEMVNFLDKHQDIGCVSPKIVYPNGANQCGPMTDMSFKEWCLIQFGVAGLRHRMATETISTIRETKGCSGACVIVRKEIWEMIGGFDESMPVAPNDIDLARRIHKTGFKVYYYGASSIVHIGSQTMHRDYRSSMAILVPSMNAFAKRYYNSTERWLYKVVFFIGSLWRAALFGLYASIRYFFYGDSENALLKSKGYLLQCRLVLVTKL